MNSVGDFQDIRNILQYQQLPQPQQNIFRAQHIQDKVTKASYNSITYASPCAILSMHSLL